MSIEYEYEVYDDFGQYDIFNDRMVALMAVNKLLDRDTNPRMYEIRRELVDHMKDLKELMNG